MRILVAAIFFLLFIQACKHAQSASACAGTTGKIASKAKDDPGAPKDYGKKAKRGGRKKPKDETKVQKKWHLFRKKKAEQKDDDQQNKHLFHNNPDKQKKLIKKRVRHPQNGLFGKHGPQVNNKISNPRFQISKREVGFGG